MSKSLKAFERLKKGNASNSDVTLIKRELKEKALLEKIVKNQIKVIGYYENLSLKYKLESDKRLKALDIIKKKKVWVAYFLKCDSIEEYNHGLYDFGKENYLTQEEYELLKEILL